MENVIPDTSFIDASKFKNPVELIKYCDGLKEKQIAEIQQSGRQFLRENGLLFTHENYTQVIKAVLAAYA